VNYNLRKLKFFVNGPCSEGRWDLAVIVNRQLIAGLADGTPPEGMFSFLVHPPAFAKRLNLPSVADLMRPALFLCVDNTRMTSNKAVEDLFARFYRYTERNNLCAVPVTLDYERRTSLYSDAYLTVAATAEDDEYPWSHMDTLVLLYAETQREGRALFKEITE
jgi:hypothetical protein